MSLSLEFRAGFAKRDITVWEEAMSMLGWGIIDNRITGAARPLFARAAVFQAASGKLAYVCVDLCFVSSALHQAVLGALEAEHPTLGFGLHNVMLTATHTHSGPSGFSQYAMFNSTNYGFSPKVFTALVDGILEAIVEADQKTEAATLRVGRTEIPKDEPFSFNRSLSSFLANPEVRRCATKTLQGHPASKLQKHEATDRLSVSLRVEDAKGRTFGLINWSAIHCTSVHADNTHLHPDNKGEAATAFEEIFCKERSFRGDLQAIFAQTTPGDLQPNFRWSPKRRRLIGVTEDDAHNAREHGLLQARYAFKAWEDAAQASPLRGPIQAVVRYADMSEQTIPESVSLRPSCRTYPACLGLRQAAGTEEGPGPLLWARGGLMLLSRVLHLVHPKGDPKLDFLEIGRGLEGRFLGVFRTRSFVPLVARFEPIIAFLHGADKAGYVGTHPWVPNVLPLQIARLGRLWLAGLPTEPTMIAGQRLQRSISQALQKFERRDASESPCIVIQGYTNAYAGYVTTREEYNRQSYEGATTYFGPWTLTAYQMLFESMLESGFPDDPRQVLQGPKPDPFEPSFLIQQRLAGRRALRGPGTFANLPAPAHLRHLRRFSPELSEESFTP